MRPIESLLPTTQLRAPVPLLFPAQRHRLFVGRALDRGPPIETGDESASRRSASLRRATHASWGRCLPYPRASVTVPLTPLSQPPLDTGARFLRGARSIHRFGESRQDRFHPTVVKTVWLFPARGAFHRQGIRCSCSDISAGDCAPFVPRFPPRIAPWGFLGARACGGCNQRALGISTLCRLRLPTARLADAS